MLYGLILRLRHLAYDKGWKKVSKASVPTICVGNVTVGGTGKTPHTELILRMLLRSDRWAFANVAVLSRGYKRKTQGFQLVPPLEGSAALYGDEPVQIANKFPAVTVAVDKDRVHGCELLAAGKSTSAGVSLRDHRGPRESVIPGVVSVRANTPGNVTFPAAQLIVLDDAFQYRKLQADMNVVLVDYHRPVYKDRLLPWGRLRDLPSRLEAAQVVIVTKCPSYIDDWERSQWRKSLRLREQQQLFFTTIRYGEVQPVFPDGDMRYAYSQRLVLFTGIANDAPLRSQLSDTYKIARRISFPDHHKYSRADIRKLSAAVKQNPTACLMTTEKDAQRMRDAKKVPEALRQRMFYLPIEAAFLTPEDEERFEALLP